MDTYQILFILTTVKHIGIPIYTQHQWLSLPQTWGWPNVRSKHVAYVLTNKSCWRIWLCLITRTEKYFKVAVFPERRSVPGASQTRNETISTLMKINTSKLEERNFQPTLSSTGTRAPRMNVLATALNVRRSLWGIPGSKIKAFMLFSLTHVVTV